MTVHPIISHLVFLALSLSTSPSLAFTETVISFSTKNNYILQKIEDKATVQKPQ